MTVEKGDKIKVEYEGKLEDGTVFDSSQRDGEEPQPIEFEVGSGQVISGLDSQVVGMNEGEEKEIDIKSQDAYGEHNPDLKQEVPRDALQGEQEPQPGMALMLGTPDGRQFPAKILDVDNEKITVDLNHPLAGKDLKFKIKVVGIDKSGGDSGSEQSEGSDGSEATQESSENTGEESSGSEEEQN